MHALIFFVIVICDGPSLVWGSWYPTYAKIFYTVYYTACVFCVIKGLSRIRSKSGAIILCMAVVLWIGEVVFTTSSFDGMI